MYNTEAKTKQTFVSLVKEHTCLDYQDDKLMNKLVHDFEDIVGFSNDQETQQQEIEEFLTERLVYKVDSDELVETAEELGEVIYSQFYMIGTEITERAFANLEMYVDFDKLGQDAVISDYIETDNFIYRA